MGRLTCLQTLPFFGVGRDEGYRIKELGPLKNLRGEIGIYNLGYVKDEEEAKSAKLKEKGIFKLGLYWGYSIAVDRFDKDEKVLEGLQPHPNLKSLRIKFYGGKKFPSWVGLSLYHNLIQIYLNRCTECEEVPTLGHLPSFRVLEIFGIWKEFGEMVALPEWLGNLSSLQELYIVDCKNLVHLPTEETMQRLTELKTVMIYVCP
ncbi:hypothetical protein SO802_022354 [Lithocarpus litseifolius]|uniref:R13L1/DRL21-like LRR repeat region domain-containing protein n=1 Tax=Lithocarpus litseifolius TaxID=425828 RepID=A0AAW2CJG8_9ROSI